MEDSKRRAYIKKQAAAKKNKKGAYPLRRQARPICPLKENQLRRWTIHLRSQRWQGQLLVRPPTPASCPLSQGLMTDEVPITKKPPVLLCEDSQYALKQISSIIKDEDYEDLGNHAMEAMGEMYLFNLTQVCTRPLCFIHPLCTLYFSNTCFLLL